MSRNRLIDKWDADLRGLPDDGVRQRARLAHSRIEDSLARGMGRSPKARMWREKLRAAEAPRAHALSRYDRRIGLPRTPR